MSTTLLWHGTFGADQHSLTHVFGSQRYVTTDNSRNHLLLALITMGEGWHNNHHYYQRSVNQGFFWWEIDPTYYVLRVLSWVGLVWDLHTPPPHVLEGPNRIGSNAAAGRAVGGSALSPGDRRNTHRSERRGRRSFQASVVQNLADTLRELFARIGLGQEPEAALCPHPGVRCHHQG